MGRDRRGVFVNEMGDLLGSRSVPGRVLEFVVPLIQPRPYRGSHEFVIDVMDVVAVFLLPFNSDLLPVDGNGGVQGSRQCIQKLHRIAVSRQHQHRLLLDIRPDGNG